MPELTTGEREFIAANKGSKTVPEIAQELKRGAATIYAYYKENRLTPYKNPDALKRDPRHPFRYMNRKIEALAVHNKILGAASKGQII